MGGLDEHFFPLCFEHRFGSYYLSSTSFINSRKQSQSISQSVSQVLSNRIQSRPGAKHEEHQEQLNHRPCLLNAINTRDT